MFTTRLTELLGVEYPIVGGTMMSITDADFVAAISQAGGLGVLASAIYKTKEEFGAAIERVKELTEKPFAVNINLFPSMRPIDNNDYTDVLIEKGVKIIETSGHSAPEELYRRWKDAGMTWIHKCAGVKYARKVASMGADAVTVVGYENGGATGRLDIGTLVMVPSVVDAVDIPVIGGGGVSDGRGLLAVLGLGASGVIMGTRLMMTREAPIHDNLKQALQSASELDTMLVMRSVGATHRAWTNAATKKIVELEAQGAGLEEVISMAAGAKALKMYREGDLDAGMVSCGQGVGLAHDIPSVKELFDRVIKEAKGIAVKLAE